MISSLEIEKGFAGMSNEHEDGSSYHFNSFSKECYKKTYFEAQINWQYIRQVNSERLSKLLQFLKSGSRGKKRRWLYIKVDISECKNESMYEFQVSRVYIKHGSHHVMCLTRQS